MSERTNRRSAHVTHFNGDFVPGSHVPAPLRERSFRWGDCAFATGRAVAGKPFRLTEIAREAVRRTP